MRCRGLCRSCIYVEYFSCSEAFDRVVVRQETHQRGIIFLKAGEKHSRWWATMTTANEQKRQTCGTVEWVQREIRWGWSGDTSSCPRCLTPDGPGASLPICDPSEKLHDEPNPDHLNVSRRSISCMNGTHCPWRLNELLSQKNALKTGTLVEPGTTRNKAVNHQPQPHHLIAVWFRRVLRIPPYVHCLNHHRRGMDIGIR